MVNTRPWIYLASASALIAIAGAQELSSAFDFAHPPLHTVELKADTISGRPDSMRLKGYYLFRDGDHFVLLSHRPDDEGQTFIGEAFVDRGSFVAPGIVDRSGNDEVGGEGHHIHWNLQTHWNRINGITLNATDARYLVLNLNDDVKQGSHLPAIFVGHDAHRFKSGSGYVIIDMLQ